MIQWNRHWIIALILLSFHGYAFAQDVVVQDELESQKQRLKALQQEMAIHRENASKVESGKRSVLKELLELDKRIAQQWENLKTTRQEWTRKELALIETQKEYAEQQQALETLKLQVERRLRVLRDMGTVGNFNVLFAAETLSELLSRETYLKLILKNDRKLRCLFKNRIKEIAKEKADLERQRKALAKAADEIETQALLFEERKQEKHAFWEELKQQGVQYDAMLRELEVAEQSLQNIIERLSIIGPEALILVDMPLSMNIFEAQKGKLNPPVIGSVSRPGSHGKRGKEGNPCVVFSAPWGCEIRAVFDGTVVYNDSLSGYGNVFIIDHGNRYFSLTGQGAKFFKIVGEDVTEGEIIGLVGGGPWIREGIYFELRHEGKCEDPLEWLDLRGIKVSR